MFYHVLLIKEAADTRTWMDDFKKTFNDRLKKLGLDKIVRVFNQPSTEELPDADSICVALYFCHTASTQNHALVDCQKRGFIIVPVYSKPENLSQEVPHALSKLHAFDWSHSSQPANELTNEALENLRITEKDRKVFMSYRRSDGYGVADQLYDALNRKSFFVYKDDFVNRVGSEFQKDLYQHMDDTGFLFFIQTKDAITSKWVLKEIDRALANNIGIAVLRFPDGKDDIPGLKKMPTFKINQDQLRCFTHVNGEDYDVLDDETLKAVIQFVMIAHAERILSRKRYFEDSIKEVLDSKNENYEHTNEGLLRVKAKEVIQTTVRTPKPSSFHILEQTKANAQYLKGTIVHGAVDISEDEKELNQWVIRGKGLDWKHLDDFIAEL